MLGGVTMWGRGNSCCLPVKVVPIFHLFGGGVCHAIVVFLHQMGEFMMHDLRNQN